MVLIDWHVCSVGIDVMSTEFNLTPDYKGKEVSKSNSAKQNKDIRTQLPK